MEREKEEEQVEEGQEEVEEEEEQVEAEAEEEQEEEGDEAPQQEPVAPVEQPPEILDEVKAVMAELVDQVDAEVQAEAKLRISQERQAKDLLARGPSFIYDSASLLISTLKTHLSSAVEKQAEAPAPVVPAPAEDGSAAAAAPAAAAAAAAAPAPVEEKLSLKSQVDQISVPLDNPFISNEQKLELLSAVVSAVQYTAASAAQQVTVLVDKAAPAVSRPFRVQFFNEESLKQKLSEIDQGLNDMVSSLRKIEDPAKRTEVLAKVKENIEETTAYVLPQDLTAMSPEEKASFQALKLVEDEIKQALKPKSKTQTSDAKQLQIELRSSIKALELLQQAEQETEESVEKTLGRRMTAEEKRAFAEKKQRIKRSAEFARRNVQDVQKLLADMKIRVTSEKRIGAALNAWQAIEANDENDRICRDVLGSMIDQVETEYKKTPEYRALVRQRRQNAEIENVVQEVMSKMILQIEREHAGIKQEVFEVLEDMMVTVECNSVLDNIISEIEHEDRVQRSASQGPLSSVMSRFNLLRKKGQAARFALPKMQNALARARQRIAARANAVSLVMEDIVEQLVMEEQRWQVMLRAVKNGEAPLGDLVNVTTNYAKSCSYDEWNHSVYEPHMVLPGRLGQPVRANAVLVGGAENNPISFSKPEGSSKRENCNNRMCASSVCHTM